MSYSIISCLPLGAKIMLMLDLHYLSSIATIFSLIFINAFLISIACIFLSHLHHVPHCIFQWLLTLENLPTLSSLLKQICLFLPVSSLSSASSHFTTSRHPVILSRICISALWSFFTETITTLNSLNSLWNSWLQFSSVHSEYFLRNVPYLGVIFTALVNMFPSNCVASVLLIFLLLTVV